MKKVIDVKLSPAGIAKAISQLEAYRRDFIEKTKLFRLRFALKVRENARELYSNAWYNDWIGKGKEQGEEMPWIPVTIDNNDDYTAVVAGGVAIFIEFGAGVYHNSPVGTSPHPLGRGLGFTIGSYPPAPSQGSQEAWSVPGEGITRGTAAQRVLYYAVRYAQPEVEDIAREVFGE